MKQIFLTISFLLITSVFSFAQMTPPVAASQNLLQNGGFEIYSNGYDVPAWDKMGSIYHLAYPTPTTNNHYIVGIDNRGLQDNAMSFLHQRVVLNQAVAKPVTVGLTVGGWQLTSGFGAGFAVFVAYCDGTSCWAWSQPNCGTFVCHAVTLNTDQIPGGKGKTIREIHVYPIVIGSGFGWFDDIGVIEN